MSVKLYSVPYFQRPYWDSEYLSTSKRLIDNKLYAIYRPNHGIAHSLRQGFLARDIVTLILQYYESPLHSWIIDRLQKDRNFVTKLAILSSFQRSGRESEISESSHPALYAKYEAADQRNFIEGVDLTYFCCRKQLRRWSRALRWGDENEIDPHVINLKLLLKAAHTLDLRRIPSFDKNRICDDVASYLGVDPNSWIIKKLWNQSGNYLKMSGDRDLELNKTEWSAA